MKQKTINILHIVSVALIPLAAFPYKGSFNVLNSKLYSLYLFSILAIIALFFMSKTNLRTKIELDEKFFLIYILYVLAATFFALNKEVAIFGSTYRKDGLLVLLIYFLVFLIAKRAKKTSKLALNLSLASSVFIALFAISQFFKFDPEFLRVYSGSWDGVAFSLFGNPNFLSSYLVIIIPISLYYYIEQEKLYGIVSFSILFLALLCTNTRGGWLAILISIILYFIMTIKKAKKYKKRWFIVFLVIIFILMFFLYATNFQFLKRFVSPIVDLKELVVNKDMSAGSNRVYVWDKTIKLIKEKPIFGYGLDNMYIAMDMKYRDIITNDFGRYRNWDKAHNEYLNIAVSSGIPSLLIYLSFIFIIIYNGINNMKRSSLHRALFISLITYLIQAFFNIEMLTVFYLFMAFAGLLSSKRHV